MGSTRLPAKIARPFGAAGTLLEHIVSRLAGAPGAAVWVATSTERADERTAALAERAGARVFRGSEEDVLGRVAACVDQLDAEPDVIVRVCADRPFVCPALLADLLELWEVAKRPDYLSNALTRSFPDGLDLELVRPDALRAAAREAEDQSEREHVTPFVYRRPHRFRLVEAYCPWGNFSSVRATIDHERDFEALLGVHERLAALDPAYDYRDVLNLAAVAPTAFP